MRAVIVFCEGRHDVLFVQQSLIALRDCEYLKGQVQNLPTPLGDPPRGEGTSLILRSYRSRPLEERFVGPATPLPPFPVFDAVLRAPDEQLFVLVRCSGDGQEKSLISLLEKLDVTITNFPPGRWEIERYAAAFLYDADEPGVEARLTKFRKSFESHFGSLHDLEAGGWLRTDTVPVGCFVFHDPASGKGALEEHVAPLVEAKWPGQWHAAVEFIDKNKQEGDRVYDRTTQRWKALITSTGQFNFPGEPMSSVFDRRRGLPQDSFHAQICQDLVAFLTDIPEE